MGKLTLLAKTAQNAGSEDEAYHEVLFVAHGPDARAWAGDPELFGVGAAGPDAGEQCRLGKLVPGDDIGAGDQAGQASG